MMRNKNRSVLTVLLSIALLLSFLPLIAPSSVLPVANADEGDLMHKGPYTYIYANEEKTGVELLCIDPNLTDDPTIPSYIDGLPVVALTAGLYDQWTNLTEVTIPETVTIIYSLFAGEKYAPEEDPSVTIKTIKVMNPMLDCELRDFRRTGWYQALPEGPVYLDGIFLGFKGNERRELKQFTIQENTISIANDAFIGCNKLETLSLPDSIKKIEESAFFECSALEIYFDGTEKQWTDDIIVEGPLFTYDGQMIDHPTANDIIPDGSHVHFKNTDMGVPGDAKRAPGDIDGNGKLEPADARLALRAAVGLEKIEKGTVEFKAADADGNEKLEPADARLILRAAVGLEKLPGLQ